MKRFIYNIIRRHIYCDHENKIKYINILDDVIHDMRSVSNINNHDFKEIFENRVINHPKFTKELEVWVRDNPDKI